jgi:HSP20 family protein
VVFARWDPLRDLLALHRERLDPTTRGDTPGWVPPIDVYETVDRYVLIAEIPGLGRSDIDIRVHDGHLVLRGERPATHTTCEQYHRVERGYGGFSRTFAMRAAVDAEGIAADLRDGILTITVPKIKEPEPRRINVS